MKKPVSPTTKNYSVTAVFIRTLFCRRTVGPFARYFVTVMRDFFFLQFSVKFNLRKIPVINVDHPLDRTVPFTPSMVHIYLDFVAFWIRPLGYLGKRFNRKVQQEYTARFLELVNRCYQDAAAVYRFRMTTTNRPAYYRGKFAIIHLFDPHYLCVPSLHVIIVVLAYTFYRKAFFELSLPDTEANELNKELVDGAISITETVLYIKQHSVNCIPAALYAMSRITPTEVTPTEVVSFINRLFATSDLVSEANVKKIREHILDMFEELYLEGCHDSDWITPLQRFLNTYALP